MAGTIEVVVETYDVAVVGGGIAGVSIAYELAGDRSVVLLEQEDQLALHTTGRSAAIYCPTYGNDTIRGLTRASRADYDRLQAEFDTPPLLTPRRLLWLSTEDTPEAHAALLAGGGEPIDGIAAQELCPAIRPDRIVEAAVLDAMDIDVMALHGGYVRGLIDRGGRVLRDAAVTTVQPADGGWLVRYRDRSVLASVVVNAAGAWADRVAGLAGVPPLGLRPLRRTIFTSPVDGHDTTGWPFVIDVHERFYFKPEGPAVLVSPGDETPADPGDDRHDDLDVARALEAVNEVTSLGLRRVSTVWTGLRTFAPDRSPVVGESARAGFVWYAGQGGYGIQMAPALARAGAALIRRQPLPEEIRAEGVTEHAIGPARFAVQAR